MRTPGILLLHLSSRQQCGRVRPHFCYAYWFFKGNKPKSNRALDRGLVGPSFCLAYWFDNLQLERRPII
jgi:hypothetical protein